MIPKSSTIPLAPSSSEGEAFFEDWMARGGTGQAKKGAAVVGSFRGLCGSGREDSENPGRRRPGLGGRDFGMAGSGQVT